MNSEFPHRASLLLNAVLATMAVVLVLHRPEPAPKAPVKTTDVAPVISDQPQSPQYPVVASVSDQRRWLIDQLRAMGVPNKVRARVALEDLEKRQNAYAAEVSLKCYGNPDTLAALQLQFDKSLDAEMRTALGEEGFKQWDRENMLREADTGEVSLTVSETDAAYDIWKKQRLRELDLEQAKVEGTKDPADISDAYAKAASEFDQQMKALLGDDRYAKSQQMATASAAAGLQQDLAKVNPNDSQFQRLLQVQQQWNDQRLALDNEYQNDPTSPDYAAQLKALNDKRDQEYRQTLGADAFNTFQEGQDPGYNQMKKYETIWGLDDSRIDSVYATMKYYQKGVEDYTQNAQAAAAQGQTVDWDTVNKNLQQFSQQTQQALQNYLGQDTFNKMLRNGVFDLTPPAFVAHNNPSQ